VSESRLDTHVQNVAQRTASASKSNFLLIAHDDDPKEALLQSYLHLQKRN